MAEAALNLTAGAPTAVAAAATGPAAPAAIAGAAAPARAARRALLGAAGSCFKFPIVVSEFGSNFEQESDVTWLADFAAWVAQQSKDVGAPVGWAWWAVNANSGDTGGIVTPSWQSFMWIKVRYLVDHMGLRPWYL